MNDIYDYDDLTLYLLQKYVNKDIDSTILIYKGLKGVGIQHGNIKQLILIYSKLNFERHYEVLKLLSKDINTIKSINYLEDMFKDVDTNLKTKSTEWFIESHKVDLKEIEEITFYMLNVMFKNLKEMFHNEEKKIENKKKVA